MPRSRSPARRRPRGRWGSTSRTCRTDTLNCSMRGSCEPPVITQCVCACGCYHVLCLIIEPTLYKNNSTIKFNKLPPIGRNITVLDHDERVGGGRAWASLDCRVWSTHQAPQPTLSTLAIPGYRLFSLMHIIIHSTNIISFSLKYFMIPTRIAKSPLTHQLA